MASMAKVLVAYASLTKHTEATTHAVLDGVRSVPGAEGELMDADDATSSAHVRAADALIVGAPVHMGGPYSRACRFVEEAVGPPWLTDELVGKMGAVFTNGGGFEGGGAGTEQAMLGGLVESGVILVPLPECSPGTQVATLGWGPNGRSEGPVHGAGRP